MRPDPAARQPQNRRPRPVQRRLLAAAAGVTILLLAGCGGGNGSGTPVSGTITIAATPGIDTVPLFIAQQKGLFTAAGLHVVIKEYPTAALDLKAVEDRTANIAAADYGNIFNVASNQGNLRILADGYDTGAGSAEILISPHATATIRSPAQLQGVTIGLPIDSLVGTAGSGSGGASSGQASVDSLLAAAATKVITNYLGGFGAQTLVWRSMSQQAEVNQLRTGQLQAALLTEPYIYDAQTSFGAPALVDAFSAETANLPLSGYVATTSWVSANPAAVADFQSAMATAQSEASMVGPVQQALTGFPGMTAEATRMISIGTYPTAPSSSALKRVEQLLLTAQMLPPKVVDLPSVPNMLVHR
jgi:NitT/TauT family transport system substrate-binding protein